MSAPAPRAALPPAAGEVLIGLEVHLQLRTRSKLFCGCSAAYGGAPNGSVCPVCLGLPGALPALNAEAVRLAALAAVGLGCEVRERSVFSRKHYFYPDLPKGYQITQHEEPLAVGGSVGGVRLRRLHLEEDSGRSRHDPAAGETAVDFARAGVPLVEIVTEPEIPDPAAARAFLTRLKRRLEYLGVSDCNMEEGSLRVDANVSIRGPGGEPLERSEVKNLNSFSAVERALAHEAERQRALFARGGRPARETRSWDAAARRTRPLRAKEETADYRYLDEPDLPPLRLDPVWVEALARGLPEMPEARSARLRDEHGLPESQAEVLTSSAALADHFEAVVAAGAGPRLAASWVLGELLAGCGGRFDPDRSGSPAALGCLLELLERERISRHRAREVFRIMLDTGADPREVVEAEGLEADRSRERLEEWVDAVLREHAEEVERYRAGDTRLLDYLMGRGMAISRGAAIPADLREILLRRLEG